MIGKRLVSAVVVLVYAGIAGAQLYRWTDEKGRVQITDTPPPVSAKNVQKRAAPAAPAAQQEPFALQKARKEFPVTLYSAPGCDLCNDARKLLNARGVPFTEISVTSSEQIEEFKKTVGGTSVPAIVIGSTVQQGYGETVYQRLLDDAGYPKTGELPPRNQAGPRLVQPKADAPDEAQDTPRGRYSPVPGNQTERPGAYLPVPGK